ncbi:hypothetical protein [Hahella ganghwensis]|uniref:hypothetical protein n=1 Tax=Hahella ganghwensis TaxID=286420 RepID=UPI00037D11A4|nr:hypothetical protein [Hahella ganghwensis]
MNEDLNLPLEWHENENPSQIGLHFIAVRYQHGFGSYDVAEWNGQDWELGYSAKVVGWVTMNEFLNVVKAGWPKHDDEVFYKPLEKELMKRRKSRPSRDDDDDFVEV